MSQVAINGQFKLGSATTETVQIDLSAKTKSIKLSRQADAPEVSALGDSAKKFAKGLIDGSVDVEIYYDATVWLQIYNLVANQTALDWTYGPEGTTTGNRKVSGTGTSGGLWLQSVDESTDINSVKMLSCKFKINGVPSVSVY